MSADEPADAPKPTNPTEIGFMVTLAPVTRDDDTVVRLGVGKTDHHHVEVRPTEARLVADILGGVVPDAKSETVEDIDVVRYAPEVWGTHVVALCVREVGWSSVILTPEQTVEVATNLWSNADYAEESNIIAESGHHSVPDFPPDYAEQERREMYEDATAAFEEGVDE